MSIKELRLSLQKEFPKNEVKWRLQQSGVGKNGFWAQAIAYIDARAVMDRLDEQVGVNNWSDRYIKHDDCVECTISLFIDGKWIDKSDVGEFTNIEKNKGGYSDAFKRAAVKWGIGRYLYEIPTTFVDCQQQRDDKNGFSNYGQTKDKKKFYWRNPR